MELSDVERLRREVHALLDLRDRAVSLAHGNIEKRLDGMNEFRAALNDQSKTFVSRSEFQLLMDRLSLLEKFQNNLQGRMTVTLILGGLFLTLIQIGITVLLRR